MVTQSFVNNVMWIFLMDGHNHGHGRSCYLVDLMDHQII